MTRDRSEGTDPEWQTPWLRGSRAIDDEARQRREGWSLDGARQRARVIFRGQMSHGPLDRDVAQVPAGGDGSMLDLKLVAVGIATIEGSATP
jgi:hypothetical protein